MIIYNKPAGKPFPGYTNKPLYYPCVGCYAAAVPPFNFCFDVYGGCNGYTYITTPYEYFMVYGTNQVNITIPSEFYITVICGGTCYQRSIYPFNLLRTNSTNYNVLMCMCVTMCASDHNNIFLGLIRGGCSFILKSTGTAFKYTLNYCKVCDSLYQVYYNGNCLAMAANNSSAIKMCIESTYGTVGYPFCIERISGDVYYKCSPI